MKTTQHLARAGIFLLAGVLLAGCQNTAPSDSALHSLVTSLPLAVSSQASPSQVAPVEENQGVSRTCQKELASLKQISPKNYSVKKAAYDRLVINSSQYDGIRGDVNSTTQDTMDALYKYKMNTLCSDIEHDVMQALIRKGESAK